MKLLGNILWLLLGGLIIALQYLMASLLLCITIIGIPFGIQTLKMGLLAIWPFGRSVRSTDQAGGCLSTVMNVVWILVGGLWISLSHLCLAFLLAITIIGIPFARQHIKLASLALTPFGKEIVED